jgi:hypothetical protein
VFECLGILQENQTQIDDQDRISIFLISDGESGGQ